ncbi:hypothetical protein ASU68_20095 [Enterobacter hormaechei subsp. oharae]|nr:hypothetical protein ASU69_19685 [Enterobacter hormaechei subsp. oharae]QLW04497.1 hypothetical protein HV129_19060 [Enterobacter hormaechei]KTK16067.1 hypothetical protein ASU68_20095 [Enterobacter hormaechei subsp. oharae]RAY70928.1 hypothetical protein DP185_08755 [Enterobacter hormaechei]HCT2233792.1 hypothetical protein [Enterobacter hormaechei]
MMKINTGGSSVNINGQEFTGHSITINNGKVSVDGVEQSGSLAEQITVTVNGNVESINTDFGTVNVTGSVGHVKTMSGDVHCNIVTGSVNTMSGYITCDSISGNASTMSGNIITKS